MISSLVTNANRAAIFFEMLGGKYLTIILQNRAEYRLILLKSEDIPRD